MRSNLTVLKYSSIEIKRTNAWAIGCSPEVAPSAAYLVHLKSRFHSVGGAIMLKYVKQQQVLSNVYFDRSVRRSVYPLLSLDASVYLRNMSKMLNHFPELGAPREGVGECNACPTTYRLCRSREPYDTKACFGHPPALHHFRRVHELRTGGRGGGTYPFVACPSRLAAEHDPFRDGARMDEGCGCGWDVAE